VLREALEYLATTNQINHLTALIHELVKTSSEDEDNAIPELDLDMNVGVVVWKEGVEEWQEKSEDELWSMLGLPEKRLPLFNEKIDMHGLHDPWDTEDKKWFDDPANQGRITPLAPRWHQLVGIYKMLDHAFKGKPILLMDEVGLGKTLQVVGVIAVLAFYRAFHDENGRFPGAFGACFPFLGNKLI
jgi:hypothetical protein